jgi:transcriptional regulator with XRE-family HTH domain
MHEDVVSRTADNDLGRAIAMLRGSRTQAAVSEAAEIDPGTWSEYETGRRRPRERNLARMVRGLGCSRLELEEAVWQLRRQRLLGSASPAGARGDAPGEVLRFAERGAPAPAPDAFRRELRAILGRLVAVLEDLFVLLVTARRGGGAADDTPAGRPGDQPRVPRRSATG